MKEKDGKAMLRTVSFTGHRPQDLGGFVPGHPTQVWVRRQLGAAVRALMRQGATDFISGMALGVDQWAAEAVLAEGGRLIAAVPCDGQDARWSQHQRQTYYRLLDRADVVHCVAPGPYEFWKMQTRNKWMVDHSDLVCAVWTGKTSGGTFNCLTYARQKQRPVYRIDPVMRQVTLPEEM